MGLNDYPQNVNDKMTMTRYDNVGWFRYAFALAPLQKWTQSGRRNSPLLPHRFTCLFAVQTTFSPLTLSRVSFLFVLLTEEGSLVPSAKRFGHQCCNNRAPTHDASFQ